MSRYISPAEIENLKLRMGVNNAGLARAVGVSNGTVVKSWLEGRTVPHPARRLKLIELKDKHAPRK